MAHRFVFVKMGVRFSRRIPGNVRVTMVFIVNVRVGVRHRRVKMLVFVSLAQMQPYAYSHQ
jgi:hypothetical protein